MGAFEYLKSIFVGRDVVPSETPKDSRLADMANQIVCKLGATVSDLENLYQESLVVNFERSSLYREIDRALLHWMVGSAAELYADTATNYSTVNNASVWVTSEKEDYVKELTGFFNRIGLEERLFDWAWTVGAYGDLFVRVDGQKELGVVCVDDSQHPINLSRLDINGRLVGFYDTPQGFQAAKKELIAPWQYVHFRLLGVRKKRPSFSDPMYTEYRTIHVISPDVKQTSTSYGSSLFMNALPIYKRLRLAEDCLLLARMSKGVLRYIYKLKVDSTNFEAVASLIDEYTVHLKRARAVDTSQNQGWFDDKYNTLGLGEDVIVPVFGDVGNLAVEKLGGETDIKWIADIEELRNQLACAIRVPLQLLGGFTGELPSSLGQSSLERLDIRFSRSSRRLQRAIIEGLKRMCQIHLAYMGKDPDPGLFDINMVSPSGAEDEEIKSALSTGVDVADKIARLFMDILGSDLKKFELASYLATNILRLHDFNMDDFVGAAVSGNMAELRNKVKEYSRSFPEDVEKGSSGNGKGSIEPGERRIFNTDLKAHLPFDGRDNDWLAKYGACRILSEVKEAKKV